MRVTFDTENTHLLNEDAIDYTKSPYELKPEFDMHCIVCIDIDTEEVYSFVQEEIKTKFVEFCKGVTHWISQNGINYDHLVLKLFLGLDYTIGPDTFDGKPVTIDDLLVMSKVLYPDRFSHSTAYYGKLFNYPKMDWRAEAISLGLITKDSPKGAEFKVYHPRMLDYCLIDTQINLKEWKYLKAEWGNWDWESAYQLEKEVAEIITRQEHRGFKFDVELAKSNIIELDILMEDIRVEVEPTLPMKKATQAIQSQFTPPATQFLKSGQPSSYIKKFAERIGGEVAGHMEVGFHLTFKGLTHPLPIPLKPLVTKSIMTLADSTQIKEYLVEEFGWEPTVFKERDLTVDTKKRKLNDEKFKAAVEKYVIQTLDSYFCKFRCAHLKVTPDHLHGKLLGHDRKKPLKVLTNPQLTIGQDKLICPNLVKLEDKYEHAQKIAHWLTYRHRRNSILGGGAGIEDEAEKGFLSFVRDDGRVATPADTCGATSRRFLHKKIANVPRVSSLFGGKMRGMFTVEASSHFLIGADFTSLEAMTEANRVFKYPNGAEYGASLTREKPNSIHCVNSRKLKISRDEAKMVKYLLSYGGQVSRLCKSTGWSLSRGRLVFNGFWEEAAPLKLLIDKLTTYWEKVGGKSFILGLDGCKISTRSKHSLLNNLLQSDGAICAKKQMVIFDRKVKALGLDVDFFKDDWRNKCYIQQLIAYHDEVQAEVAKSLVEFKKFESEEEAKEFKESNKNQGDIIKAKGSFFVPYSIAGVLMQEAAVEAGEFYNLNVTLGMDYTVGDSWRSTH